MLGSLAAIWISMMLIILLGMMFAIGSVVNAFAGKNAATEVGFNTVLCLRLDRVVEERTSTPTFYDLINETPQNQSLADIVSALAAAKDDDNITGLYIACDGAPARIATSEAIRKAVTDFGESGKWVVAYADNYTQGDYYIATAADEVYLNPVGGVDLRGLASGIPFFKGLLDKVGVEMQIVKVGTFKSAVEPYTMTHMSEANRLQTHVFLDNIWARIAGSIGESRGISTDSINMMADSLATLTAPERLVEMKLVDALKYRNEMSDYLKDKTGTDRDDDLAMVTVSEYLASGVEVPNEKSEKNKIAVYYAYGDITESAKDGIASDRVVPDILKLADDDDIEAMVLRVNSGGGSAFASEQIWQALEVFKGKGKKLYVSMGDYAASGGYYISCGAEKIFAQPMTLTGSIGIFGMIPCFKELVNDKLGVNIDYVSTNANSSGPNSFEPLTPFQHAKLQGEVNRGYELFTSRCAEGRHVSQDSIKAIAEGRVWDGSTARKIGLVDELGYLSDAIEALAEEMGYDKYQVVAYPDPKTSFWDIVSELNSQMRINAAKEELGQYYPVYNRIKEIKDMAPVQARMEEMVIF